MKKLVSLVVGAALLTTVSGILTAQTGTVKSTTSNPSEQVDKASPKQMTGKIMQIDKDGQTFLIVSNGKQYRFTYGKIEWAYKVGQIVDVSYVVNPGGQMEATKLNSSKSNVY
jgi:translation elongation factor P/translation initiation factor 5A